ncbi:tetratricopeptide repeat protein [Desulfogranum japonicum]|uniref:tetratricopeptide repeat protein n=1 Tax=Desulfogranum japonicum TaxID=231447 RepID=UPI000407BECB|nr:tetratricopeptide repeat protein [Desulfogranum japonicum]
MEPEQKKIWDQIMNEWDSDNISCHRLYAKLYTAKYPNDVFGWIALADALSKIAKYDEARDALEKANLLSSKDHLHIVYHQIGHLYKEKGDHPLAERWYRKAVEAKETTRNLIFLGACLAKQGKFTEAKKYHRKAIEVASDIPEEAYYNLGLIFNAEERFADAYKCFNKALDLDPEYTVAKDARADALKALQIV